MKSKYRSTAEVAAFLADDPEVEDRVNKEISRNSMVTFLMQSRIAKDMTQEQIAKEMNCAASKISRLESSPDSKLKWDDIVGYSSALNMNITLAFEEPDIPAANRIKTCVFKISECLDELTELARQSEDADDKLARKIHEFSGEVLFNFLKRYNHHSQELQAVLKFPSRSSKNPTVTLRSEDEELMLPCGK